MQIVLYLLVLYNIPQLDVKNYQCWFFSFLIFSKYSTNIEANCLSTQATCKFDRKIYEPKMAKFVIICDKFEIKNITRSARFVSDGSLRIDESN